MFNNEELFVDVENRILGNLLQLLAYSSVCQCWFVWRPTSHSSS